MTGIPTMEEFSEKMRQIYTKIRNSERDVYEKGLIADPEVINRKGAYLVAYRFSDYFTEELENISFKISNLAPAVFYKRRNIHSTIISYKLSDNFHPDQTIIKSLMQAVYSGMIKRFLIPVINYRELIFNQNSVILEGSPSDSYYYESVKDIIESCYENNLDVAFPWGCHITISRFTKNISPQSQEQKRFLSYIKKHRIPSYSNVYARNTIKSVYAQRIDVGHCQIDEDDFEFFVSGSFPFPLLYGSC